MGFSSGGQTGADFKIFVRLFKKHLKSILPKDIEITCDKKCHYFLSGFLKRNGKYIYYSISDVRYFPNSWVENILIRTAKHDKDWTGGSNNYTTLENFKAGIEKLFAWQEKSFGVIS